MLNEKIFKNKIIEAGISGKLTEQLISDGNAEDLYNEIQKEKEKLMKEGKIKKEKALPSITDDEIPFEIPKNWKWCRTGNIGQWQAGATPLTSNDLYYKNGTIPWILTGDLHDEIINYSNHFITKKALEETSVKLNPIGAVLIAMYGATIGKLAILNIEATTNQACCACIPFKGVYNRFIFYYLMAIKKNLIFKAIGDAQPNISKEKIVNTLFPLPPLAEQKRIVKKLDALLEK